MLTKYLTGIYRKIEENFQIARGNASELHLSRIQFVDSYFIRHWLLQSEAVKRAMIWLF